MKDLLKLTTWVWFVGDALLYMSDLFCLKSSFSVYLRWAFDDSASRQILELFADLNPGS